MIDIARVYEAIDAFILTNPTEEYSVKIEKDGRQRPYLGLSQIGHKCSRYLFFSFRHCFKPTFSARVHRLFRRGDLAEYTFVWLLRGIGFEVFEVDDEGKQFSVSDYESHVKGNLDGVAIIPDHFWLDGAEPHPVLTEYKTASDKKFNELVKVGVEKWNSSYFGQLQTYCGYQNLKGALFFAVNKNDDSLYIEYVPFKKSKFRSLVEKAGDIISAQEPPDRMMGASASYFECRWCPAHGLCFKKEPSQLICRTCKFATPMADKQWECGKGRVYGEVCKEYVDIAQK